MMTMMMTSLLLYDNPREIRQPHTVDREALDGGDCGKGVVTFNGTRSQVFFFFCQVLCEQSTDGTGQDRVKIQAEQSIQGVCLHIQRAL